MWWNTLRALAVERRAVPIALVCVPIVILETRFGGFRGTLLAVTIFAGFLLIGPPSYRALFPVWSDRDSPPAAARSVRAARRGLRNQLRHSAATSPAGEEVDLSGFDHLVLGSAALLGRQLGIGA
jgi:hypothetical protein